MGNRRKTWATPGLAWPARRVWRLLGLLIGLVVTAVPVGAQVTYTVTTNMDVIANDGQCSLREAIQEANNGADTDCPGSPSNGNDLINFNNTFTITLGSTLPTIVSGQGTLTIDGVGQNITIDGNNAYRVMMVDPGANLTLQNLTIYNANPGSGSLGGAIQNRGTLTTNTCTFDQNRATSGGAIYNDTGATLTVAQSQFWRNSTSSEGGAIANYGTLTVTSTLFTSNTAGTFGGAVSHLGSSLSITGCNFANNTAANGGGAMSTWNGNNITVTTSSFSNNQVTAGAWGGGGIMAFGGNLLKVSLSTFFNNSANVGGGISANNVQLVIANSTFFQNSATGSSGLGGGVLNNTALVWIYNSTFSENTAPNGGALGVWDSSPSLDPSTTVWNSILANSTAPEDCWNVGTLAGNNNIIENPGTGTTSCAAIALSTADPQLASYNLAGYLPLNPGSPAIDTGDPSTCNNTDVNNQSQNGIVRPQDGDGNAIPQCDIGSFEAPALVADMVANGMPPSPIVIAPGAVYSSVSFSCTNNGPDAAANATCGVSASAGTVSAVTCSPSVPVASLPATAPNNVINCTFTFTAPGTAGGSDTPETGVTFAFTTAAPNDTNPGNNSVTSGPWPLLDAVNDAASFPAGTMGATFNVGSNDQYGTGSLPSGANFTLQAGTTCGGASINSTTGIATFNVPGSGTCVVAYEVCYGTCDTAQLVVTAQQAEAIPTLEEWGLLTLVSLLAASGVVLLRRLWA